MKIAPQRLAQTLAGGLAPIYLVAGDEHLLVAEACDAIRARARAEHYDERDILFTGRGFDWNGLAASGATMSLFAEKRLVELRMPSGKPGRDGAKALGAYTSNPPIDTALLVVSGKLDRSAANSAWVKSIVQRGVFVQIYPVDAARLPEWIGQRMQARGMRASSGATRLLAERVEGNLLSANQEIEKLLLLEGPGTIDENAVRRAVADSARFDVFQLTDAALAGDVARAMRILAGLRSEGSEPPLLLWALTRELRTLAAVLWRTEHGESQAAALQGVWPKRHPIMRRALARLGDSATVQRLALAAARADRIAKGGLAGRPWDALSGLVSALAGVAPLAGESTPRGRAT